MTPPVCVWCLRPASDHIHDSHPFTGPRVEVHLTPRELVRQIAGELRKIAREQIGADATASDALDLIV
jgi:hypothetical protein